VIVRVPGVAEPPEAGITRIPAGQAPQLLAQLPDRGTIAAGPGTPGRILRLPVSRAGTAAAIRQLTRAILASRESLARLWYQRERAWWRRRQACQCSLCPGGRGPAIALASSRLISGTVNGIMPGLVGPEAVLPGFGSFFDWPAEAGGADQPGLGAQLALGHVAVAEGQLTGADVPPDEQVVRGEAVPSHAQAYQRSPLEPLPAERISRRRGCLSSAATASAQVSTVPLRIVMRKLHGTRST